MPSFSRPIASKLPDVGTTIFTVMSRLAQEHNAINLSQGFPDFDCAKELRDLVTKYINAGLNQYPPMAGVMRLRERISEKAETLYGAKYDPEHEVTVTPGATYAIFNAVATIVRPGDEVILFEPMYDSYLPMARRAGANVKLVRLEPPHWRIDEAKLAAAFTPKTRAMMLTTPHNPAASVFPREDLEIIARLCAAHDTVAISDEVWEHVLFDGRTHASMLHTLRDRTIKIGSAGKMFQMTGWKVGFVCAAPPLTEVFAKAHQFLTFTTPPNLQTAAAYGLGKEKAYFDATRAAFQRSRDRLASALQQEGFVTLPAAGAYFLSIDLERSGIAMPTDEFALRCVKEAGVAVIPFSPFYAEPNAPPLVRLCFAKKDETLDRGVERLAKARQLLS